MEVNNLNQRTIGIDYFRKNKEPMVFMKNIAKI
jgi:hypothetical protein